MGSLFVDVKPEITGTVGITNQVAVTITSSLPVVNYGTTPAGKLVPSKIRSTGETFVEVGGSNVSAFGDIITVNSHPIFQFDFVGTPVSASVMNQMGGAFVVSGGLAGNNNGRLALQTGTNPNGQASFISNKPARYRAGQGVEARFTCLWPSGSSSGSYAIVGMCAPVIEWTDAPTAPGWPIISAESGDGYFFGYQGTSFGILHKNARTGLNTFISQSSWNGDTCDGTDGTANPSLFNWDKSKGNVCMIRYPYLGYGDIKFYVQNDLDGRWIQCHTVQYTNANTEVQISNPSLHFLVETDNNGLSTTNNVIYVGSVGVFVSGEQEFLGPQFGADARLANNTANTELPVLSIRNCTSMNGVPNCGTIRLRSVSFSGDSANTDTRFRIRKNSTLTNASFTAIYGTVQTASNGYILTNAQSIATVDVAATAVSAIPAGASDVVFNAAAARNTGYQIDLSPYELFIGPGETFVCTMISSANNNSVQVAINWEEDV
jgi:hypothetical protein